MGSTHNGVAGKLITVCLDIGWSRVGMGRTQMNPHLVENSSGLGWTVNRICSSDAGWIDSTKMKGRVHPHRLRPSLFLSVPMRGGRRTASGRRSKQHAAGQRGRDEGERSDKHAGGEEQE